MLLLWFWIPNVKCTKKSARIEVFTTIKKIITIYTSCTSILCHAQAFQHIRENIRSIRSPIYSLYTRLAKPLHNSTFKKYHLHIYIYIYIYIYMKLYIERLRSGGGGGGGASSSLHPKNISHQNHLSPKASPRRVLTLSLKKSLETFLVDFAFPNPVVSMS